jgi:hypothetical protein
LSGLGLKSQAKKAITDNGSATIKSIGNITKLNCAITRMNGSATIKSIGNVTILCHILSILIRGWLEFPPNSPLPPLYV